MRVLLHLHFLVRSVFVDFDYCGRLFGCNIGASIFGSGSMPGLRKIGESGLLFLTHSAVPGLVVGVLW